MSRSLPELQQHAQERAGEFCARYVKLRPRKGRKARPESPGDTPARRPQSKPGAFYRPRDPEACLFLQVVREYFDEFERAYSERYQKGYGYWRPVIRTSIDKFVKCGDLKEGFARVRCPDCGKEFFVAFSCRQRKCCSSGDGRWGRWQNMSLVYGAGDPPHCLRMPLPCNVRGPDRATLVRDHHDRARSSAVATHGR